MKAFFAAVIGKSGYEKWNVNEPGGFYFLFYVQSREIPKKTVAGVARKESSWYEITRARNRPRYEINAISK